VAAVACWFLPEGMGAKLLWPLMILLLAATALGAPVFVMMGGAAMLLFWSQETPVGAVPVESYRLVVSPTLPTIPLFTLAGYILAEGGASHRLVRLFRAWFGWFPGGTAVVAGLVCAFFTTFTGGSGVTILALGGLLLPVLLREKFGERFSLGLLTSAGSLGLLFPPSLPVILYGIVSKSDIINLFIAGFVPGCLILLTCAAWAMREGIVTGAGRAPFDAREARAALWEAKWEILLPVVVLVGIFGGFATLVEAAAISALYAFTVECLINRDLKFWIRRPGGGLAPESGGPKDLPEVITECATLLGGVLIILGVALGLTSYIVDAEIPARAAEWTRSAVHSQLLFLLGLNFFLLIVGMLMDIFSATIVVVPIITPIGLAFGVDPVHLGIVFLANLELGFLTPPVGMNLFLAAYRFKRPLPEIYRSAMPWMILRILCVLIITYVPAMTTGVLHAFGR
jgi:tripartite ATP-independent transporter DctM subunit